MGKKRKRPRIIQPDETLNFGPFKAARYGRFTIMASDVEPEQFEAAKAKMAERFPQLVAELDALVQGIVARVATLPPDKLLQRGWWEMGFTFSGFNANESDQDRSLALRMVDYIQSLIAATPRDPIQLAELSDEDWTALKADVGSLFERLPVEYQVCRTAYSQAQDKNLDMELEEFRVRAETLWAVVRGKRYHVHERKALLDVIEPHSDELEKLFGISATELVGEVEKLLAKFTHGMMETMAALDAFRTRTLEGVEALAKANPELSLAALRNEVFKDAELARERDRVMNDMFGLGLFDIATNTNLPPALIHELTWAPGEETDFLSPGNYSGWPFRVWPTMKRPFIRLDGRAYCFDVISLFDNLYRVIQRAIFRLDEAYRPVWNARQKAVSEALPFKYLGRLIPNSTQYSSVYYRCKVGNGAFQWYEADGLVIFGDHLLVIEVKAGAFTYTSPATDLPAHIASLRNLVQSPAVQGARFIDYLESADEVAIYNEAHEEITRLRRNKFRQVGICAITLDAFSDLAARAHHLKGVGINVGARPVWVVSIDDLRAYADLFANPLIFLHFVEQRMRAAQSELLNLNDEMDHFGLYISQNNYAQFAEELANGRTSHLTFDGYGKPVDDYFGAVLRGDPADPPSQKTPSRITEIIDVLWRAGAPESSELTSYLLDCNGDLRDQIAAGIEEQLSGNRRLKRARPLSTYGNAPVTIHVWSPDAPLVKGESLDHTRCVVALHGERERRLIELEYDRDDSLASARSEVVTLNGLNAAALARAHRGAQNIRERRLIAAGVEGKIGRNDGCPCGSGRKYKHCCRP